MPKPFTVLFLCTGNSARSILAEAIMNHIGGGRFRAFSAGSQPKGQVHPLSLNLLRKNDIAIDGLHSKSWTAFAGADAPAMDLIVTVCDSAAGEACPIWPGHPLTAHWGMPDPAAAEGPPDERRAAFNDAFETLERRIHMLAGLPVESLAPETLKRRVQEIGRLPAVGGAAP